VVNLLGKVYERSSGKDPLLGLRKRLVHERSGDWMVLAYEQSETRVDLTQEGSRGVVFSQ